MIEIIKIPDPERYISLAFRRGEAHGIKEAGPKWSVVAGAGSGGSLAFNGYVDIADGLPQGVARLFIERYDSESDDDGDVHWVRESSTPSAAANDGWMHSHNLINFRLYRISRLRSRFLIDSAGIF